MRIIFVARELHPRFVMEFSTWLEPFVILGAGLGGFGLAFLLQRVVLGAWLRAMNPDWRRRP